jgi:hypothetical protein
MGNKKPGKQKSKKHTSRRHQMKKLLIALAAIGSVNLSPRFFTLE